MIHPQRHSRAGRHTPYGSLAALCGCLAVLVILAAGCDEPDRPPSVIWVLVDALGRDYVGAYGHPDQITPNLDRLSREGTLVRRTITSYTVTAASVSSMLSSRWRAAEGEGNNRLRLRPGAQFVSSLLADQGYATVAFHRNPTILNVRGWAEEFQEVGIAGDWSAGTLHPMAEAWLRAHRDQPFLLYLHYMDVHVPYTPRPPLERLFPAPDTTWKPINGPAEGYTSASLARGRALYRGGIRDWDRYLGELLRLLEELELLDRSLLVVTADHGDEFGEHGAVGHGTSSHHETVTVPLLLRYPGHVPEGRVMDGLVRTLDLPPTVLDLLGLDPPRKWQGSSLGPHLQPGAPAPWRTAFTTGKTRGWRTREETLVFPWELPPRLYDPRVDPGERQDLATLRPGELGRIRGRFQEWRTTHIRPEIDQPLRAIKPAGPTQPPDLQDELKALGYL